MHGSLNVKIPFTRQRGMGTQQTLNLPQHKRI